VTKLNFIQEKVETAKQQGEFMDWREFYKLNVTRETLEGQHPYFHAELKVSDKFDMDELLMREFYTFI
jgi:hypothetical protein